MRSSRSSTAPRAGRVCVERLREPADVARDLTETDDEVAQLRDGRLELRGQPFERRQSMLGRRGERPGAVAVVRIDRRWRPRGRRLRAPRRGGSARARHEAPPPPLAPAPPCPRPAHRAPPAAPVRSLRRARAPRRVVSGRRECRATPSRASCPLRARCAGPANASRRSSWCAGRASRRCANWPESASSRSVAATRSSRATLRPHA